MPRPTHNGTISFASLPSDLLQHIILFLDPPSLRNLRLVNDRLCELTTTVLFPILDLQAKQTSEVERVFKALFDPLSCSGRLRRHAFKTVMINLESAMYDMCDPGAMQEAVEEAERQVAVERCLEAVASIGTLRIDLLLQSDVQPDTLVKSIVPALRAVASTAASKAGNVEISIKCAEPSEASRPLSTSALSAVLDCFEQDLVSALRFESVRFDAASHTISALTSPFLRKLTVSECLGNLSLWRPSNLRQLSFTFGDSGDSASCTGFQVACRLGQASAATLQELTLRHNGIIDDLSLPESGPTELPSLARLRIIDDGLQEESLLERVVISLHMPNLHALRLEKAYTYVADVSHLLPAFSSLQTLDIQESRLRPLSFCGDDSYPAISKACIEAGVHLRNEYLALQIDDEEDLEGDLARVALLSPTLVALTLRLCFSSLDHLKAGTVVDLPKVETISLQMADLSGTMNDDKKNASQPSILGLLLAMLDAPAATKLTLDLFLGKDDHVMSDLIDFLVAGHLPAVRELAGSIALADVGSSGRCIREHEAELRHACQLLNIDASAIVFLSGAESSQWDEEIESDGIADSDEVDSEGYEEDDGADSGAAVQHASDDDANADERQDVQTVRLRDGIAANELLGREELTERVGDDATIQALRAMETVFFVLDGDQALFCELDGDGDSACGDAVGDLRFCEITLDEPEKPEPGELAVLDSAKLKWFGEDVGDLREPIALTKSSKHEAAILPEDRSVRANVRHCPGSRCSQ